MTQTGVQIPGDSPIPGLTAPGLVMVQAACSWLVKRAKVQNTGRNSQVTPEISFNDLRQTR